VSLSLEDEDTWEEDFRRGDEPLEIRLSIQPAVARIGNSNREDAQRLLAELLGAPEEERSRLLRERRFHDPELLDLLLESGSSASAVRLT